MNKDYNRAYIILKQHRTLTIMLFSMTWDPKQSKNKIKNTSFSMWSQTYWNQCLFASLTMWKHPSIYAVLLLFYSRTCPAAPEASCVSFMDSFIMSETVSQWVIRSIIYSLGNKVHSSRDLEFTVSWSWTLSWTERNRAQCSSHFKPSTCSDSNVCCMFFIN